MGRGLSELQKSILRLAYANHVREGRRPPSYGLLMGPYTQDAVAGMELRQVLPAGAPEPVQNHWLHRGGQLWICVGHFSEQHDADAAAASVTQQADLAPLGLSLRVEGNYGAGADVYTHEVLLECYGFDQHRKLLLNGEPTALRYSEAHERNNEYWRDLAGKRIVGSHFISKTSVGSARYNAAMVATSKAFKRLEERGLAVKLTGIGSQWSGLQLTGAGIELARSLTANTNDVVTSISR